MAKKNLSSICTWKLSANIRKSCLFKQQLSNAWAIPVLNSFQPPLPLAGCGLAEQRESFKPQVWGVMLWLLYVLVSRIYWCQLEKNSSEVKMKCKNNGNPAKHIGNCLPNTAAVTASSLPTSNHNKQGKLLLVKQKNKLVASSGSAESSWSSQNLQTLTGFVIPPPAAESFPKPQWLLGLKSPHLPVAALLSYFPHHKTA